MKDKFREDLISRIEWRKKDCYKRDKFGINANMRTAHELHILLDILTTYDYIKRKE